MKKRILALLMAAAMMFALAACSNQSGETSDPPAGESTPASEPAGEEPGGETEGNVLKLGALLNTTGWFASIDYNNQIEMQTLVDYLNEQGGIEIGGETYTLELVVEDGGSDVEGIRSAAQRLVDAGIKYVIETNDFWVEGAVDIFESAGVINVMTQNNMNYNAINEDLKYSFNFSNSCTSLYATAVQVLAENYPEATKLVYACDDNGVNDEQAALVKAACEQYGLEYVDSPVIYDGETTDFSSIALRIAGTGADAFIGNGTPDNIAAILKELRNSGSDMVGCAVITMMPNTFVAGSGLNDLSNAFSLPLNDVNDTANNTEMFNTIYSRFVETYGEDSATAWSGASLDNLYTLLQLMQDAGSVDVDEVCAYIDSAETVETLFGTGTICGEETFGVAHCVAHNVVGVKLENGENVNMGSYESIAP